MLIEIVAQQSEVVIKWAAFRAVDVGSMSVKTVVGRWLAFTYILAIPAEGAMGQV